MKRYGASAALALMFGGAAAVIAGCPGYTFESRPFNVGGAAGAGGSGGVGGNGGAGECGCPSKPPPCKLNVCGDAETCMQVPDPAMVGKSCGTDSECSEQGECLLADTQPCSVGTQCRSGFCADGVCCVESCSGVCQSCIVPGNIGKCTTAAKLPTGWPDDSCEMSGTACRNQKCEKGGALGKPCGMASDCLNDNCVGGYCRLPDAQPCNDPVQCATNYCDLFTSKCAIPQNTVDCRSHELGANNNKCNGAPGEPCGGSGGNGIGCTLGTCSNKICRANNQAPCTKSHECLSNFCKGAGGGGVAACDNCTGDEDCGGMNGACSGGTCTLPQFPDGAYCFDKSDCSSDSCDGFPQKCQPQQPQP